MANHRSRVATVVEYFSLENEMADVQVQTNVDVAKRYSRLTAL
jgi:hypothetical protein